MTTSDNNQTQNNIETQNNNQTLKLMIKAQREQYLSAEMRKNLRLESDLHRLARQATNEVDSTVADKAWNQLFETIKNFKSEWQRGYNNDYYTSMCAILLMVSEFCKAIGASKPIPTLVWLILDLFIDDLITSLNESFYSSPPEAVLPTLLLHTKFTDDGKLKLPSLADIKRSDEETLFPKQSSEEDQVRQVELQNKLELQLKNCLIEFLKSKGYHQSTPGADFIHEQTQDVLNENNFEPLRESLSMALKHEFEMDFELAAIPTAIPSF